MDEVFGDRSIPQYELNELTINYLYKLSQHNQKMNHLTELQIKDSQRKVHEYEKQGGCFDFKSKWPLTANYVLELLNLC